MKQVTVCIGRDKILKRYTSASEPAQSVFPWSNEDISTFAVWVGNEFRKAASTEEIEFRVVYGKGIKPNERVFLSRELRQRGFGCGHRYAEGSEAASLAEQTYVVVEEGPVSHQGVLAVRYSAKYKSGALEGAYSVHPTHKVHTILTPQQIAEEVERHAIKTHRRSVEYCFLVSGATSENSSGWIFPEHLSGVLEPNLESLERTGSGGTGVVFNRNMKSKFGLVFEKNFDTNLGHVYAPSGTLFVDYETLNCMDKTLTQKEVALLNKLSKHTPKEGDKT